jgi:transcriptional regulator with XRE-family HTH domain
MGRERLAARRRELGLTQEQLAFALGHDPATIGRWERDKSTPQPLHRRPLADALGLTLPELNAMLVGTEVAMPAGVVDLGDTVDRDSAAATDQVSALRATTGQIVSLDTRHGGDDLVHLAVRSFRGSHRELVRGRHRPGLERELGSAVAEAGQVAAWVAYDADDQALSRQLHHEALLVARLAADRDMELFLLASLAMQDVYVGNGAEALRIAEDVLESHRLSGRTAALFHVRRARALALGSDRAHALGTLRQAESLLAEGTGDRDPLWTWWITDAELAWHEGMIRASTGDWRAAVDSFHAAMDARGPDLRRSHYNDAAHLWWSLLAVGAWRDAETVVAKLVARLDDLRSGRTRTLLRRGIDLVDRAGSVPSGLADGTHDLRRRLTA